MSQSYSPSIDHSARSGRAHLAGTVSRHLHKKQDGYTLTHAGRQVRIGPVAFWIVVGTLVVMGVWSIATGTYFAFKEDVLTRLLGRQATMQTAYEDRIAELRAQVDRITSRQLLDQEQFEKKLDGLVKRQAVLEQRTMTLSGDLVTTGSIPRMRGSADVRSENKPAKVKPSPISDTVMFTPPPDREARLYSRETPTGAVRVASRGNGAGLDGVLARVGHALDKVENRQTALLTDMEERYDTKARHIRSVLDDLGVAAAKPSPHAGVGGPFIPVRAPRTGASAFERQMYRINLARVEVDRYTRTLVAVPVRKPISGTVDMSSPFGVRADPFLGRPALHSGIDLRGDTGEAVHVTANGKVTIAGWEGGYGKMIEVNHGNGLATRYGHLSAIEVKVGQVVRAGQVIGRIGSTGRSTGPHLHYETRINGEATNPQKFLRAGIRLGSL